MGSQAMDALAEALDAEHSALMINDAEALLAANDAKLAALRALETVDRAEQNVDRLRSLMERNRANGALLARRQREVRWALRHLGRSDGNTQYSADGRLGTGLRSRALGVG